MRKLLMITMVGAALTVAACGSRSTTNNTTSTNTTTTELGNDEMTGLFQGVAEATEEAIYNSLFMATTVTARGGTVEAIPVAEVVRIVDGHGMLRR